MICSRFVMTYQHGLIPSSWNKAEFRSRSHDMDAAPSPSFRRVCHASAGLVYKCGMDRAEAWRAIAHASDRYGMSNVTTFNMLAHDMIRKMKSKSFFYCSNRKPSMKKTRKRTRE